MNITVFLSSRNGVNPQFIKTSKRLGELLALNGHTLVYGGSKEGCMGAISDEALNNQGKVIAVYPDGALPLEPPRENATKLYMAPNMDERKRLLIDLSEAYIILAGGFGTMEEAFQLLTEMSINQTEIKPVVFVGRDFYQPLFDLMETQVEQNMLDLEVVKAIKLADSADEAISILGDVFINDTTN